MRSVSLLELCLLGFLCLSMNALRLSVRVSNSGGERSRCFGTMALKALSPGQILMSNKVGANIDAGVI